MNAGLLGAGVLAVLAGAAATTLVALEAGEVVVLRTFADDERVHEARIWIADDAGFSWIEAAGPDKQFYRRLLARPEVEVVRPVGTLRCRADPQPTAAAHARMRTLFTRKYGLADWWIGLFVDTSASVAVRLLGCTAVDADPSAGAADLFESTPTGG